MCALITAAPSRAPLRLLSEARHGLCVVPAGAVEVAVVLVAVFLQPTTHVPLYLVTAE